MLLFLLAVVLVPGFLILCFTLFRAQLGYWHLFSAWCRCFPLYVTTVHWSRWYLLCAAVSQLHCTWMPMENLKSPSPIYDHSNISGHKVTINNFEIVGREDLNQMRTIKEAIYIRVNDPSLNRNVGKYHLPHVWDEVLANISELKLK